MFSVSHPTAQVVSNRCVTETKLTLAAAGVFGLLAGSILTVTGMLGLFTPKWLPMARAGMSTLLIWPLPAGWALTVPGCLCVMSTGHFRSGFGPIAGSIFNVNAASVFTQDVSKLPFKRLGWKSFPMQPEMTFEL